jgi:hypothetical protein
MNQRAGFAILLFVALLLIVSSVSVKVTAQGSTGSEKSTTDANGPCSPELFKAKPALCAALLALKHTSAKGSSASAEKSTAEKTSVENLKLFPSSPAIEVKKLPTMEENKGLTGFLTGKLEIKKPGVNQAQKIGIEIPKIKGLSVHCAEGWHQAKMRSGELVCLTTHATGAVKPVAERPLVPCKGPAGTNNGIASLYTGRQEGVKEGVPTGKCEVSLGHVKPMS